MADEARQKQTKAPSASPTAGSDSVHGPASRRLKTSAAKTKTFLTQWTGRRVRNSSINNP